MSQSLRDVEGRTFMPQTTEAVTDARCCPHCQRHMILMEKLVQLGEEQLAELRKLKWHARK